MFVRRVLNTAATLECHSLRVWNVFPYSHHHPRQRYQQFEANVITSNLKPPLPPPKKTPQVGVGGGREDDPFPFNAPDLAQSLFGASPLPSPCEEKYVPATAPLDTPHYHYYHHHPHHNHNHHHQQGPAGADGGGGGGTGNASAASLALGIGRTDMELDMDMGMGMDLGMGMDIDSGAQLVVPEGGGGGAWMWCDRYPGVVIPGGLGCC